MAMHSVLLASVACLAGATTATAADICPNSEFRTGYSSQLPDCRAYEQATPVEKNGGNANSELSLSEASLAGDAVTFFSNAGIPGGEGAQDYPIYLARRDTTGQWLSEGLYPPASAGSEALVRGWNSDLSEVFNQGRFLGEGPALFTRQSESGLLTAIVPPTLGTFYYYFAGSSDGGSEVLFESTQELDAGAIPGSSNIYLWDRESNLISLVSVLNEELSPPNGSFAGPFSWTNDQTNIGGSQLRLLTRDTNVLSTDGAQAFFTSAGEAQLYLRENPAEAQSALDLDGNCTEAAKACTVRVSESEKTDGGGPDGTDPNGPLPAAFMAATPSGSSVFFTSSEELTNDANTGPDPAVARANLDGSGVDLSFIPVGARGVALDGTYVYWCDPKTGAIGRAKLDGSEIDREFITGGNNPQGVAVDATSIYWTNASTESNGAGSIGRANLDGTSVNQSFITGANNPRGVAVNATHIFWGNSGTSAATRRIARANLDGTGVNQAFINSGGASRPSGLALNATHVYWANSLGNAIGRSNLDGTGIATTFIMGASDPQGVAIDGTYVYWSNRGADTIGRAKLDGTEPNQAFVSGIVGPLGLAVNASHIYWGTNAENPGNDLYRYDSATGDLTDITADDTDLNGAEVRGVLGISDDGSHVYFAANGVLAPGASLGSCDLGPEGLVGNECNLYLWENGTITFIADLNNGGGVALYDGANWQPGAQAESVALQKTARVTPDGSTLLFRSQLQLAAYDNQGVPELYRYSANGGDLDCVSCNPSGAPPTGPAAVFPNPGLVVPAPSPASFLSRNLSNSGERIFFETPDALVSSDTNSVSDVYQWEANGSGSCTSESQNGGCLSLISTGRAADGATFVDASASGDDVFVLTNQQLVGQDQDQLGDIYDARVEGGLASQYPSEQAPCVGDACKATPLAAPDALVPGSTAGLGSGNAPPGGPARCGRTKVRRGKRCVSRKALARKACRHRSGVAKQNCLRRRLQHRSETRRGYGYWASAEQRVGR